MKHLSGGTRSFTLVLGMVTLAAVSLSLTGASVWEGAAAMAPRGDLPEDGYYAATNSFPPNTVVDIINLETGKSIRAIVASGLNTPGLLAILSPDAASRIGLGTKTIGRIRMSQPEDPIAFARFTEGLVASGDPDYDPTAMLAVDQAAEQAETAVPPKPDSGGITGVQKPPADTPPRQSELPPVSYEPMSLEHPDYAEYSQNSIVSVGKASGNSETPREQTAGEREPGWNELSSSAYLFSGEDSPERTNYPIWEQGGSVGIPETRETVSAEPAAGTEPLAGAEPPDQTGEPDYVVEPSPPASPWEEAWNMTGEPQGRFVAEAQSSAKSPSGESSASSRILIQQPAQEYILVPAEERPPVRGPESASGSPAAGTPAPQTSDWIDESLFIDSIEKIRERQSAEAARLAEEQRVAEAARLAEEQRAAEAARLAEEQRAAEAARLAEEQRAAEAARLAEEQRAAEAARLARERPEVIVILPAEPAKPQGSLPDARSPEDEPRGPFVEPLAAAPSGQEISPEPPRITTDLPKSPPENKAKSSFSIPVNMITEIEKGKYYVQLGAFRSAASVESALLKLDPGYPVNVQNSGSADNPMYRILVGPVNLGESGALVQRFKGSGYRDAYIQTGR
ncbi:MAG: SPOR domain-containing protein [Treponema sp.]|nr:SPOR domain-containing protein [Treponema sp.]